MSSRSGDSPRRAAGATPARAARRTPSKPERVARIAILLLVGVIVVVVATKLRSPLEVSEQAVRAMVDTGTLVGLPLADAAKRLQHEAPGTRDGLVNFDFAHIHGWTAGTLQLDVRDGRVVSAMWLSRSEPIGRPR